jgi:hypothetical protein
VYRLDFNKIIFAFNYFMHRELNIINKKQNHAQVTSVSSKLYDDLKEQERTAKLKTVFVQPILDSNDKKSLIVNDERYYETAEQDYFRYRCFELCAYEIINNHINGEVAEAGVFRGIFARLINAVFPDRKLYLFDTFESYNPDEFEAEVKKGRFEPKLFDGHLDTNVELVLNIMEHPDSCVIRKGYFPQTAEGLENERFSFVSIDLNLEQSTYDALVWFYPRLNEGGYIFMHDYNIYDSIKTAVERYERDYGSVKKIPIADFAGTLVIVK